MRRLLTTLVILLVVIIAGMTSLVFLINPNDFRDYMTDRVEQKSGYQLAINGDLRWHVWPQLSIIAGQTSLTAPGAAKPVVSAENMRLDVKLWPLLSHQLAVRQVMFKNAVIRLTPESEAHMPDAPIAPSSSVQPPSELEAGWKFDIDKISVDDSLLIWQRGVNDQINVRDLNLQLVQNAHRQATLELSSRINRNQRDLAFSLSADLDMQKYPEQFSANVSKFTYQLKGADIPAQGIQGGGTAQASYQRNNQRLTLSQLALTANDNQLSGTAEATLSGTADYQINLNAEKLDLDALSGWQAKTPGQTAQVTKAVTSAPVIARDVSKEINNFSVLTSFNANLALNVADLTYRGLKIQGFSLLAENSQGRVNLKTLSGKMSAGDFSLPGTMDATKIPVLISLKPVVHNIELGQLLTAYNLPQVLSGSFSLDGNVSGQGLSTVDFSQNWHGNGRLAMENARLHGLNIQQLIQQAVTRNNNSVQGLERYDHFTAVKTMQAQGELKDGTLQLSHLMADSAMLTAKGAGTLDFPNNQCDMNLSVRVTGGWKGNSDLITRLQNTEIPLRVYGPWTQLNYQLQVDQILRSQLQNEAKSAIQNWIEKNKGSKEGKDLKSLIK
ncbi:outer membrane assembly protein AsmA [Hafnia psychrotolerans]|uniref:Outer membrane assembly protein AsmA n=1 Tax=Hafnia psychrotolerans TaxID=1477018 RepID=A0ABQ1G1N1_9GAMM|nr:outer membrane assembly protein AsmA [Hafnia psychrotolerans]GGA34875.1 outer membrane assembly protein AsmA [Hafnia psychrotolerans]